jgi:hypothetical membrane protein
MSRIEDIAGMMAGILSISVLTSFTAYASHLDPEFRLFYSYLSDLGVGPGGWWFNTGIILASSFGMIFVVLGLRPSLSKSISREMGVSFACIMCLFGILAGIFTEDDYVLHTIASWGVFISMGVALGFFTYALRIDDPLGEMVTQVTELFLAGCIVLFILGANPVGETVTVALIMVWISMIIVARGKQVLEGDEKVAMASGLTSH